MFIPKFSLNAEDFSNKNVAIYSTIGATSAQDLFESILKTPGIGINGHIVYSLEKYKNYDYFFIDEPLDAFDITFIAEHFNLGLTAAELKKLVSVYKKIGFRLTQNTNKVFWY